MKWKEFNRVLLAPHSGRPQEVTRLTQALRELEGALSTLAQFGHLFHLEPGQGPEPAQWPRTMFHVDKAPNGLLVSDEDQFDLLGTDWFDSLEEAAHAAGYDAQMSGRGGRPRRARAVSVLIPPLTETQRIDEREAHRRTAREVAVKLRDNGRTI